MKTKLLLLSIILLASLSSLAGGEGKIIFSKKPITATSPDNFPVETFDYSDKIYCRAFLPKKISEYKFDTEHTKSYINRVDFKVTIEGEKSKIYTAMIHAKDDEATAVDFILGQEFDDGIISSSYINELNALAVGKYNLIVEGYIWPKRGITGESKPKTLSLGTITLNKTKDSAPFKTGKHLEDIEAGMSNPALEAKALATIKDFCKKKNWALQKEKAIIRSKDWKIYRDPYTGAIVYRKLYVAILVKDNSIKDNKACKVVSLGLLQAYAGSVGYNENFTEVSASFYGSAMRDTEEWADPADCD